MKFKVLLAAALAVAVSAPALAKDEDSEAAPKEKKICRTETITGSLVAKHRICMTKAEWDQMAAAAKKQMDDYTRKMGNREGAGQAGGPG